MKEKQQEKSFIKQNILLYLSHRGVTPYEFYKNSGVTRGILQQNNGISEDNIARFLAYAPDVNIEWLLTGRGHLVKDNNPITSELVHTDPVNEINYIPPTDSITSITPPITKVHTAKQVSDGVKEGIPLIPFNAMAGAFTGEASVMEYECERYVIPDFKGADFLMRVKGDSMQPTYYAGDLVACQRVPLNDIFFQWNKTYVLDTTQGAIIKRIRKGSDNNHILIVSDNVDYEPFELSKDQFNGVALVRGLVRLE